MKASFQKKKKQKRSQTKASLNDLKAGEENDSKTLIKKLIENFNISTGIVSNDLRVISNKNN